MAAARATELWRWRMISVFFVIHFSYLILEWFVLNLLLVGLPYARFSCQLFVTRRQRCRAKNSKAKS